MPRETSSRILSVFWLQQGLLLSEPYSKTFIIGRIARCLMSRVCVAQCCMYSNACVGR
jgi:hypothetical protein